MATVGAIFRVEFLSELLSFLSESRKKLNNTNNNSCTVGRGLDRSGPFWALWLRGESNYTLDPASDCYGLVSGSFFYSWVGAVLDSPTACVGEPFSAKCSVPECDRYPGLFPGCCHLGLHSGSISYTLHGASLGITQMAGRNAAQGTRTYSL